MTRGEFDAYLLCVAFLAFAIGVVNLTRPAKRWLGVGAVCMGAAMLLYRMGVPTWGVGLVGVLAAGCLGIDVSTRARGRV